LLVQADDFGKIRTRLVNGRPRCDRYAGRSAGREELPPPRRPEV